MLSQPKNACLRLLNSAIKLSPRDGLSQLGDVISLIQADPGLSPDWERASEGTGPLWDEIIHVLGRAQASGHVPMVRHASIQHALYGIWKRDGLDLSATGPILARTIAHGLAEFALLRDQDCAFSKQDIQTIAANTQAMVSGQLKVLVKAWRDHPSLSDVARHWKENFGKWEWMAPDTTQRNIASRRSPQPWTADEAQSYMLLRVLPDWQARPRPNHSRIDSIHIASGVAYDSQVLIEKLTPQAWSQILDSMPAGEGLELIIHLREAAGLKGRKMDLNMPSPSREYLSALIEKFSQPKSRHLLDGNHVQGKVLREFANAFIDQVLSRQDLDWSDVGLGLHAYALCSSSISNKFQNWAAERLNQRPSYPEPDPACSSPLRRGLVLSLWIVGSPPNQLASRLDHWEALHGSPVGKFDQEVSDYHKILANSLFIRFSRAIDSPSLWPRLASIFWTHALRCDGPTLRSLLEKTMRPVPASRPDIFAIDPAYSALGKVLGDVSGLPQMASDKDRVSLRRCVLRLSAAMSSPSPHREGKKPTLL